MNNIIYITICVATSIVLLRKFVFRAFQSNKISEFKYGVYVNTIYNQIVLFTEDSKPVSEDFLKRHACLGEFTSKNGFIDEGLRIAAYQSQIRGFPIYICFEIKETLISKNQKLTTNNGFLSLDRIFKNNPK